MRSISQNKKKERKTSDVDEHSHIFERERERKNSLVETMEIVNAAEQAISILRTLEEFSSFNVQSGIAFLTTLIENEKEKKNDVATKEDSEKDKAEENALKPLNTLNSTDHFQLKIEDVETSTKGSSSLHLEPYTLLDYHIIPSKPQQLSEKPIWTTAVFLPCGKLLVSEGPDMLVDFEFGARVAPWGTHTTVRDSIIRPSSEVKETKVLTYYFAQNWFDALKNNQRPGTKIVVEDESKPGQLSSTVFTVASQSFKDPKKNWGSWGSHFLAVSDSWDIKMFARNDLFVPWTLIAFIKVFLNPQFGEGGPFNDILKMSTPEVFTLMCEQKASPEWDVGDQVMAHDRMGIWYQAIVKGFRTNNSNIEFFVHFWGWPSYYDEWLTTDKMKPISTYDKEKFAQEHSLLINLEDCFDKKSDETDDEDDEGDDHNTGLLPIDYGMKNPDTLDDLIPIRILHTSEEEHKRRHFIVECLSGARHGMILDVPMHMIYPLMDILQVQVKDNQFIEKFSLVGTVLVGCKPKGQPMLISSLDEEKPFPCIVMQNTGSFSADDWIEVHLIGTTKMVLVQVSKLRPFKDAVFPQYMPAIQDANTYYDLVVDGMLVKGFWKQTQYGLLKMRYTKYDSSEEEVWVNFGCQDTTFKSFRTLLTEPHSMKEVNLLHC